MRILLIPMMVLVGAWSAWAEDARPAKPNILLILVDDLGWQDVTCYDIDEPTPMETPNLDALASKGVKFWQAYSPAPVCAPSRAAILSGNHPARGEMTSVAGGNPPHPGHPTGAAMMSPWYSSRMPMSTYTLAEAMKAEGYVTGHSGKWHISKNHYAYPQPFQHGFDVSVHQRGVQVNMKPDRLTGFATTDPNDPYRLDENGYPFDQPQHAAMTFIQENKDQPFFLYYATWLVHGPWVMRSEALLRKYEKKLGVTITEEHKKSWNILGQKNPFYCAMVEQLDYYLGQIFTYLETTDDPRWPGHKLIENSYIIFTSDNGGMEQDETVTDNYPLDQGKISVKEGGVRVPLIMTGPGIPAGVESDVMVNGLDFFPTILSWVGAKKSADKQFDGCDLTPLLSGDYKDPALVRDGQGNVRDTMMWHFPQMENSSSIRVGDYKLVRRYNTTNSLELYRLYRPGDARPTRVDIEEMKNLAAELPEKTAELDARLTEIVEEMGGRTPYFNPTFRGNLPGKDKAPEVLSCKQTGRTVEVTYKGNGAKVVQADLMYALKGGDRDEEWLRLTAKLEGDNKVIAELPRQTSHYFINLIDENNFLVCYPAIDAPKMRTEKIPFSVFAQSAGYPEPEQGDPIDLAEQFARLSRAEGNAVVLQSEDFEDEASCSVNLGNQGVSITNDVAASGSGCLRFFDSKAFTRDWMPMVHQDVNLPGDRKSGTFRIAFDVMLDQEVPGKLSLQLRDDDAGKRYSLGSLMMGDGAMIANGLTVAAIQPGQWVHLEISFQVGPERNRMFDLSATTIDGRAWRDRVPYQDHHFDRPDSIQLVSLGSEESLIYMDNLVLSLEK